MVPDFNEQLAGIELEDPFAVARVLPAALLDVELKALPLPRRASTTFRTARLRTVRDALSLGLEGLTRLRNFGAQSVRDFAQALAVYALSGHLEADSSAAEFSSESTVPDDSSGSVEDRLAKVDPTDPFSIAAAMPESWLAVDLFVLPLTTRLRNALRLTTLKTVGDVIALGPDGLRAVRNLGRTSIRDLGLSMVEYLKADDLGSKASELAESEEAPEPPAPLHAAVAASLKALKERDAYVLCARIGRDGDPLTLDEIGAVLGVTRERCRQLELRARTKILDQAWPSNLKERIRSLLSDRTEPLYLDLIAAEDPWFDGFQDNLAWLGGLITEFASGGVHVWQLEGRLTASRLSEEKWSELRESVLAALEGQLTTALTAQQVTLIVEAIGSGFGAPDLILPLNRSIEPLLHFAADPNRESRLVAVGRGMKPALASIFRETDRPLHIREVRQRLEDRGYTLSGDNSLRTAIRSSGLLIFGRSIYGTRSHLGLDAAAFEELRTELIEIIDEDPEHQWHSTELAEELQRRGLSSADELDRYAVNAILSGSVEVSYLGRLIWKSRHRGRLSTKDRHDVAVLMESVLVRAGRPLTKRAMRDEIEKARGLNVTFLPQPSERVIRLGNGRWGLVARDCRLSPEQAEEAFRKLESILSARGRALHASELMPELARAGAKLPSSARDELLGRAQIDSRFRVARGGFLSLPGWDSIGRTTVADALEQVLLELNGPVETDEVHRRVERIVERPISRAYISAWFGRTGLIFDPSTGRWDRPTAQEEDDSVD